MIHPVHKSTNLVVGAELHKALFGIVLVPVFPHAAPAVLSEGIWGDEDKRNEDVLSETGKTLARGHDVGSMIPHISAPHLLLLLHIPLSGSKTMFGSSSIQTPKGPLAVSLLPGGSINLTCSDPVPLPLGFVDAGSTHLAGLTIGDVISGVVAMAVEIGASALLSRIMQWGPIEHGLRRLTDRIGPAIFRTVIRVDQVAEWSLTSVAIGGERLMVETVRQSASVSVDRVLANPVERIVAQEAVDSVAEAVIGEQSGFDQTVERSQEAIYEIPAPEYPTHPSEGGELLR